MYQYVPPGGTRTTTWELMFQTLFSVMTVANDQKHSDLQQTRTSYGSGGQRFRGVSRLRPFRKLWGKAIVGIFPLLEVAGLLGSWGAGTIRCPCFTDEETTQRRLSGGGKHLSWLFLKL